MSTCVTCDLDHILFQRTREKIASCRRRAFFVSSDRRGVGWRKRGVVVGTKRKINLTVPDPSHPGAAAAARSFPPSPGTRRTRTKREKRFLVTCYFIRLGKETHTRGGVRVQIDLSRRVSPRVQSRRGAGGGARPCRRFSL